MNIALKNVSFSYTESLDDAVIKNLNFEIKSGECVVLVGESGCGKTTISKLINGLIPLYQSGTMAGDVLLGDKNSADMTLAEISRYVGSVFQNPRSQFFNIDTDSEIAFGCENLGMDPEEIRERVNRVVKEFHIEHLAGRNIFHLSGGEKQKIACASVSATDPEIFVLDEPSANLDLKTVADLAEIIKFWKSCGKTVVVVEHRIHYLRHIADRICYVKDGRIAYEWTPAELEAKGSEYTASLGLRCMNLKQVGENCHPGAEGDRVYGSNQDDIKFNNLHFAYNRKFPVLDIPTLTLPRGQITAIIGHNGAGKSTLAKVLCKKSGAYLIMQDVNHQLFTESVLDEVLLGMRPQNEKAALEILGGLNLEQFANEHPMALSGGQKQRVAIGSGVSSGHGIVVFDEPTSGLDYRQMLAVSAVLQKLAASGKTLLVITHDPEFILNCCSNIIRMERGKIAEQHPLQGHQEKLIESMMNV